MYFEDLKIKYPNGSMIIHMNCFFPATAPKIRTLYRTIELSDDPDALVDKILRHLSNRTLDLEATARKAVKDMVDDKTAYEEKKAQYSSGKRPNGVPIRKDQLPEWKKKVQELDEKWRTDKRVYDSAMREQKKLSQNRLLLLSLNGRC